MHRVGMAALLVALVVVFASSNFASAQADGGGPRARARSTSEPATDVEQAVLYTIGPGAEVFERWGHSVLCFQPESAFEKPGKEGVAERPDREELLGTSCFDFGIFPRLAPSEVVLGSLRGERLFVPQQLDYESIVGRYWHLDRTVERQVLPLDPEQVLDLRDRVEQSAGEGEGYAYHPFSNNCSTQIRDAILGVWGGELAERVPGSGKTSLRTIAESGFSGNVFALGGLELFVGASADGGATPHELAAFPDGLKALVRDEMGAESVTVYQQSWTPLPTSVHAGRILLILVSLLGSGALWFSCRRSKTKGESCAKAVRGVCFVVAGLGVVALMLRFISDYPEFSSNWMPIIFFPLDAAVPWMKGELSQRYLTARLGIVLVLAILSVTSVLAQPLLVQAVVVGLPLTMILLLGARQAQGGPSVQRLPGAGPTTADPV